VINGRGTCSGPGAEGWIRGVPWNYLDPGRHAAGRSFGDPHSLASIQQHLRKRPPHLARTKQDVKVTIHAVGFAPLIDDRCCLTGVAMQSRSASIAIVGLGRFGSKQMRGIWQRRVCSLSNSHPALQGPPDLSAGFNPQCKGQTSECLA
jgi:hypothetical protein